MQEWQPRTVARIYRKSRRSVAKAAELGGVCICRAYRVLDEANVPQGLGEKVMAPVNDLIVPLYRDCELSLRDCATATGLSYGRLVLRSRGKESSIRYGGGEYPRAA